MEPFNNSQTVRDLGVHLSRTHGPARENNPTVPSSSIEDLNERSSASNPVDDPTISMPSHPVNEQDEDPDTTLSYQQPDEAQYQDLYETNPDDYVPWLPQRKKDGILSVLQKTALFILIWSICWSAIFISLLAMGEDYNKPHKWNDRLSRIMNILRTFARAMANWSPIIIIYVGFLFGKLNIDNKLKVYYAVTVSTLLFGSLSWANYALSVYTDTFQVWWFTALPDTFHGCNARVTEQQSGLFDQGVYYAQFDRIEVRNNNSFRSYRMINTSLFQDIRGNYTLCDQGFQGDSDYYGIGIRSGLYLQWMASLLANNLLPQTRTELQKVYLVYSLAICIATIVTTFSKACTFSIEIEILYWLYWGGYICVFGSSPDAIIPGSRVKWVQLDWTIIMLFVEHWIMIYHGIWFIWYGYDQFFARMPCGTYQFLLAPLLDPSERYSGVRDLLMILSLPSIALLLLVFPVLVILLATEIKHTVQSSAIFATFFRQQNVVSTSNNPNEEGAQNLHVRVYQGIRNMYGDIRNYVGLPSHSRKGIRLITPVDIRHRRQHRILYASIGIFSISLTITAIKLTLKWNKVLEINNLAATGQYVSLIVGAGCLIHVLWRLLLQESERRRKLRIQQILQQETEEGIELETPSARFSDAVRHAFAQRDAEFLRSGGVLFDTESVARQYADSTSNDAYMSGGLGVTNETRGREVQA